MIGTRLHRAPVGPWLPYGCPCPPGWEFEQKEWEVPPETRYQARVRQMSEAEYAEELTHRAGLVRAEEEARAAVRIGDRVQRVRCGGGIGTFTLTHWAGPWMCGKSVDDCHPVNVRKVNGLVVSFGGSDG